MKKKKKIIIISAVSAAVVAAAAGTVLGIMFGGHVHTMTPHMGVNATCTEDGSETYYYCADCGKYFSDMAGTQEISPDDAIIPATGHNIAYVEETAATCTADGEIAHWYCPRCNTAFEDEGATRPLEAEGLVIGALGHDWDEGRVTTPVTCTTDGEKTYTCTREGCGEERVEDIVHEGHKYSDEYTDQTRDELEHWLACSVCGAEEEGTRAYHDFVTDSAVDKCACGVRVEYSQGLDYTFSEEGSYYIVWSAGTFEGRNLFIPESYDDGTNGSRPVRVIAENAFSYNDDISLVRLTDNIQFIGTNAFFMCGNLALLTLGEGLETIGESAFYGCDITTLTIPASVTQIGAQAFAECALTSVTFENTAGWTDGTSAVDFTNPQTAAEILIAAEYTSFVRNEQ